MIGVPSDLGDKIRLGGVGQGKIGIRRMVEYLFGYGDLAVKGSGVDDDVGRDDLGRERVWDVLGCRGCMVSRGGLISLKT